MVVFVILNVYHHKFGFHPLYLVFLVLVFVKMVHHVIVNDTVVKMDRVMILLVFVVVSTKMKRDYAVVITLIQIVMIHVFVFLLTPETLGIIVVVKKLIL